MTIPKKSAVLMLLITLVVLGLAATKPAKDPIYKNLQVLPKDTNKEDMDRIMHGFNKDLGVKCNFCHSRSEDGKSDFASDKKGEKKVTRDMMRMTMDLNKQYFHVKEPYIGDSVSVVTCFTCHHGNAYIENEPIEKKD